MQVVCDINIMFWNVCAGQPKEVHDVGSLKIQIFTKHWGIMRFSRNLWQLLDVWSAFHTSLEM
jgi:hypothetical protein